jgi:diguanylate cyclase (GGDEF)-like protein
MTTPLSVLLIEDSREDAERLVDVLVAGGYSVEVERVETRAALQAALARRAWDLVITDYVMPGLSGASVLRTVREHDADQPLVVVSGFPGEDLAVSAMKHGADDYVMKSELRRLVPAARRALLEAAARRERTRADRRNAHLAYHDSLTDLPNRLLLADRLRQSVAAAHRDRQPMTVLVMDLDGFKEINDTLGHEAGDRVLRQVAERLRARLREVDTVARLGGDEFAVVLPSTDVHGAERTARKLLEDLAQPIAIGARPIAVRASIGIARFPEDGSTGDTLLRHADLAMYLAKADGSSVEVYRMNGGGRTHRRLEISGDLPEAIGRGQFFLEYQPVLHLRTGAVISVEALVRWNHLKYGRLLPGEFIDLAEQVDAIDALTAFVVDRALQDWQIAPPITVAVNLSPRCLNDPQLPQQMAKLLRARETPPSMLALEITESFAPSDRAMRCLARLHEMGIRLAVDDFGAGNSSLRQLRRLPVDELKLDRSFVADLETGDDVLMRSSVMLAHSLGLSVVAKGVESETARDQLLACHCDAVQGTLISRPLPPDEMHHWMTRRGAS